MVQFSRLFTTGRIANLEIRNRIVMAPMGTHTTRNRTMTDQVTDFYVERAKGGVGLIITEVASVWRRAAPPDMSALYSDEFIPPLRKLTGEVHKHGAKIGVQIGHLGIVASPGGTAGSGVRFDAKEPPMEVVAPSALPYLMTGEPPRELSPEDIEEMVEAFAAAACRAREAGFDLVELHGAHGCLMSMFLSPFTNKRTDRYGGNVENRCRFATEAIELIRKKAGSDYPVTIRINGEDGMPGGTDPAEAARQAEIMERAGAAAIHVTAGFHQMWPSTIPSCVVVPEPFVSMAAAVKKAVSVPVIGVGKLGDPAVAERVLEEGNADFIALGRPLLADPHLPNKARDGRLREIQRCLYCNNCMEKEINARLRGRGRGCTVNPALLRERELAFGKAARPRDVMVAGGGLAGMEAARGLAERGHRVTLYERSGGLGGQWNIASLEAWKKDYSDLTERLKAALGRLGVKVCLNAEVTRELVVKTRPEVVVLATGASPMTLNVPGIDNPMVVQANDVLLGKAKTGRQVVVVGGRYRGLETAVLLAEQGKKVAIVDKIQIGFNLGQYNFFPLKEKLRELGVPFYPNVQIIEIRDDGVTVAGGHEIIFLKADSVVLAVGSVSENGLAKGLEGLAELYSIGDCVQPRTALDATNEAAEVAGKI